MSLPTPEEVAADKAALDVDLQRLLQASRQRAKLPAADPTPAVGPFSHLRAALKVMKRAPLLERVTGFEDSWLDFVLREQQDLPRPWVQTFDEYIERWGKTSSVVRKLGKAGGIAVLENARGQVLVLSPRGARAAVYVLDETGVTQVGRSVADFVHREVAARFGEPLEPIAVEVRAANGDQRRCEKLRKAQPAASQIRGSLAIAWSVHDVPSLDALIKLDDLARDHDLVLIAGFGDAESIPTHTPMWLSHWLIGVELAATRGGAEQRRGFAFDADQLSAASKKLDAIAPALRKLCNGSKRERGTFVVARGGLALASLVKGVWVDPPAAAKRDADVLATWLADKQPATTADPPRVGYASGTRGATQQPFPGVVHGIAVGGADQCAEPVDWSARRDKALERELVKAGIADARYFLITRFD